MKTTLSTLNAYPESMLARMFSEQNKHLLQIQSDGSVFIDTNPNILQLYRRPNFDPNIGSLNISDDVWQAELDYWGISPLRCEIFKEYISYKEIQREITENCCRYFRNDTEIGPRFISGEKFSKVLLLGKDIDLIGTTLFDENFD